MSFTGDKILPKFRSRHLAFYLSIYQEKILSTEKVTERVQLLDVKLNKWIGFPSLNLALEYVVAETNHPIPAHKIN